jgi:hypothetical protein
MFSGHPFISSATAIPLPIYFQTEALPIRPSGWLHFSLFTRGFYGCPTMTANNRPTRKPDKYRWLPEVRFGEVMVPAYGHLDW